MHLKRFSMPKFWPLPKKHYKYVVCPSPGPHPKDYCFPLLVLVRDVLKLGEKGKEAKKIIKAKEILIDGRARNEHKFPVGLMDIIEIPKINKTFIVLPSKKGLEVREIESKTKTKLCKIINKKMVKGDKIQITLHDGKNFLIEKKDKDKFKTGDTVEIDLEKMEIKEVYPYKENSWVLIIRGENCGKKGKILKVVKERNFETQKVVLDVEGRELILPKTHIFVIPDKWIV